MAATTPTTGRFAAAAASVALLVVMFSECRGQCGGKTKLVHASSASKNITSPGYPDTDYSNNLNCSWQIVAGNTMDAIHLYVNDLQLDSNYANCRYDYVDLFDGNYYLERLKRGTPVLARLCNAKYGRDYYSTTPYLHVLFISDSTVTARGFSLAYRAVPKSQVPTPPPAVSFTPLYNKGEDSEITISVSKESEESGLKLLAVIGGIFGTFMGLTFTIAFLICICRYCLKMYDAPPASTRVPSAPHPEETQRGSGRPPRDPMSYTAVLINSDSAPSSHPATHRDDGHGHGRSSRPSSRLEPSGANRRSGSPRPSSREGGGSSRHLDVPERGHQSGSSDRGSPRQGRRPRSAGHDVRPRSSGGAYPSPAPAPQGSSARTRYSDPPPSYDEVMGSFPEASAPPLPPSDYR